MSASLAPTASPAPPPSPSPSPTAAALKLPASGALAAGTYYVENRPFTNARRLTFTVPAGWTIFDDVVAKHADSPGEVMFVYWVVSHIFADACGWEETALMDGQPVDNEGQIVDVGTTPHELVLALASQEGREETAGEWPWQGTLGGFPAEGVELAVPADLDTATCTGGILRYWPDPGPNYRGGLCCNRPGNIDFIYAVDINGKTMALVARHYPDSSPADLAELDGILQSMEIQP